MNADDRIQAIQAQNAVTGIDFIYVQEGQLNLDVFFLRSPHDLANPLVGDLTKSDIHITCRSTPNDPTEIPIVSIGWDIVDGKHVLQIETEYPGDFSIYELFIDDPERRIDPYFNRISFSFKANCPSDLDCRTPEPECPPETIVDFPINYQARDFWSFRQALLDFASLRYPDWKDRLEADVGVMLAEVMSALGDEMAYYQDRVSREAYLHTLTQRRSLKHHASLVDYNVHDGAGAFIWTDIQLKAGNSLNLPAGTKVWTQADSGLRIVFELGNGLAEVYPPPPFDQPELAFDQPVQYHVDAILNKIDPHCWDEDDVCLPIGTIELFLSGHFEETLDTPGKWILLKTSPDPSLPERRHMVRLVEVENQTDPVFGVPITRIRWEPEQALPYEMDMTVLKIHANMVPATAGEQLEAFFAVGIPTETLDITDSFRRNITRAVERQGPNEGAVYLYGLKGSENNPLVWLGKEVQQLKPEVRLFEIDPDTELEVPGLTRQWEMKKSLLKGYASQSQNRHFTLESGTWKRVVGDQRIGKEIVHQDYAHSAGHTIRFGDGEFGATPAEGTIFKVVYRLGNGRRTNIPAGGLSFSADDWSEIDHISNPLPGMYGLDEEPIEQVRQLAPEAFQSITYRAVRPEDYAEAAERLAWVQSAGASLRWTGSWLSAFVTPDPLGAVVITENQREELNEQLDRFRQAGREAHISNPIYADMDFEITICVQPNAYKGEVKQRVLLALMGKGGVRPYRGYFSPDNFTFGTTLYRSALEAAIQSVEGVRAVQRIVFRRRGWFAWRLFRNLSYYPGKDAIIRVENNPRFPERGSLKLKMTGGA
ncbi:MAG: hypothetical protein MI974_04980 [Chitinophagales bacterium]|nr:hypothetical protein [Chitinophagales bacterium]